jgi:ABC-type branched-subunit amino acid transport system substrate-binding protein
LIRMLAVLATFGLLLTACPADEVEDDPVVDDTDVDDDVDDDDDDVDVDEEARGDGVLRLGYLLPETGALAFLGPPMITAVEMAVEDVNEAGGVLGNPVELSAGDEAGNAAFPSQTVDRHLADGVDAIIGAAASGMSLAVIDKITGAEVVQCSPSNTSPTFTTYDDGGYYFRNAPSDALQGPVLAETMVGDGHTNIVVMGRADDYGQALADATAEALAEQGADVADVIIYDPEAATFDSEVEQVVGASPDAVALVAFDEGVQIIQGLLEAGMGADQIYGADGIASVTLNESVDPANPNVIDGMRGTTVAAVTDEDFAGRLRDYGGIDDTLFGAEAYDCVVVIALAAIAAGSDDPRDFVNEVINVTRDGTTCTSFSECAELLEAGEDIDYDGFSGPLDYTENGEPARGVYDVWEWQDGEHVVLRQVEGTLE